MKHLSEIIDFLKQENLLDCVLTKDFVPDFTLTGIFEQGDRELWQKIAPIYHDSTLGDVFWAMNKVFIVQSFHMPEAYANTLQHIDHITLVVHDIGYALHRLRNFI